MRLIHCADLHLGIETYGRLDVGTGLSTRTVDCLQALDELVEFALRNDVEAVLFCGDAYKGLHPSQTHQRELAMRLKRLADGGIRTVMVLGNHDAARAPGRASTPDIFRTLSPGGMVSVASEPEVLKYSGWQLVAVPWLFPSQVFSAGELRELGIGQVGPALAQHIERSIVELGQALDPKMPRILAAHVSVEGSRLGSEQWMMLGDACGVLRLGALHAELFDYVALGHHHLAQELGANVMYAGSLQRVDFGEDDSPKGFYVVDLEPGKPAHVRFQPVGARRFVTVEVKPLREDPTPETVAAVERAGVADAIVRVVIKVSPPKAALLREHEVRQALAPAHFIAYIRKDVLEGDRRRVEDDQHLESMTVRQALSLYLAQKAVAPDRRQVLLQAADKLMIGGQKGEQE